MARKQTLQLAEDAAVDRLVVSALSKVGVLVPPWVVGLLMVGLAWLSHRVWGQPPAVTWATMASTLGTVALTSLTWMVSHNRNLLGRVHSTLTTGGAGMWFAIATITGVGQIITLGMLFFGGIGLAIGWNIRAVIRQNDSGSGVVDPLGNLFKQAREKVGLGDAQVRTREVTEHKIKGKMALPAGEKTQADAVKATDRIESGLRFPPGSVLIAGDKDDASQVHFTVTDPRVMDKPIPWPGPSRPGASIAEPVRVGLFQDSEFAEPELPGNHLMITGASGSGKSIGGTWNIGAEVITRMDVAFFGVDLAKDAQTFAPLRPGMHGIHVTKERAVRFIRALHEEIPKRTKWLSDHGYTEWEPGCGLLFWVVVFEEVAKTFDQIGGKDEERVEQIAKEIRSAGGHVIMSLQKAIYSEMSTVVRGQLGKMTFGINDPDDLQYSLSEKQQKAEADPTQWGAGKPEHVGKAYIDCRGIPDTHIAMPLRTYAFGETPRAAAAALTAHAAQWPASTRPMDEFTARLAALDPQAPRPGQAIPMPAASAPARPALAAPADDEDREPEENQAAAELLADAAEMVVAKQHASPQMLQRAFRLSHTDCLRLLEALERRGIIGPATGDPMAPRKVLVTADAIADGSTVLDDLREDGDAVADYQRTADPDPTITAGPDDEVEEPTLKEDRFHVRRDPRKLPPAESRKVLEQWVRDRASSGKLTFAASELVQVWTSTGNKRPWAYKALNELADRGVLEKAGKGFEIVDLDALDPVPAGAGVQL